MKKPCFSVMVLICACCLFGCHYTPKYWPLDSPGTRWISQDPVGWFDIPEDLSATSSWDAYGELEWNETVVPVTLFFETDSHNVFFSETTYGAYVLTGRAKYESDQMVLYVDIDHLYNEEYETITFVKNSSSTITSMTTV